MSMSSSREADRKADSAIDEIKESVMPGERKSTPVAELSSSSSPLVELSSGPLPESSTSEFTSSSSGFQYSAYPGAVNVGVANGIVQQTAGYVTSPMYNPYQQSYHAPLYAHSYQDWMPQVSASGHHAQRRFPYQYGVPQIDPFVPFSHTLAPNPQHAGNHWKSSENQASRKSSWMAPYRFHHNGRHSTNFVNQRIVQNSQHSGYQPISDISPMYTQQLVHSVTAANAIALAQVAQQAALQTSSKYGTASTLSSPGSTGSPSGTSIGISPDVLTKMNSGKPIPPPVPSLFAAPTFEEALESSLYNPNNTTNVYIRGLPPDTTDASLIDICERFGAIESSKAIVDSQTNQCKGFGFVLFANEVDATSCIAGLIQFGYQVSFAKESFSTRLKNLQDPESTNLYLSNLPLDMHEKDLEELFQPYKVISNRILRDSNNMSRGVGFARMGDRESAEAIIANFDNSPVGKDASSLPLQVRFADSQSQKRLKAVTQRRRQWRAREYNILTQGLDHPIPCLLPIEESFVPLDGLHHEDSSSSVNQSYPASPQISQSGALLAYGPSAQPRTMPGSGSENSSGHVDKKATSLANVDQVAERLGEELAI